MSYLAIAAIGLAMGFFGSIPLTGPIAVMAVGHALRREYLHGFVVAIGGTLGELIYCSLAVAGVGVMLQEIPGLTRWVRLFSAVLLFGVGVWFFFNVPSEPDSFEEPDDRYWTSFSKAFSVAAFNPVLLLNWTAAVAFGFSLADISPTWSSGSLFVAGVGAGIVTWFGILMRLLKYYQEEIPAVILQRIQQVMSLLMMAGAVYLAVDELVLS